MRGDKLRKVIKDLGFKTIPTVICSGNVIFESPLTDAAAMEAKIEAAWPGKLGFNDATIIRSQDQLQRLAAKKPFGARAHNQKSHFAVTFCKDEPPPRLSFAHRPASRAY